LPQKQRNDFGRLQKKAFQFSLSISREKIEKKYTEIVQRLDGFCLLKTKKGLQIPLANFNK
jgi:hypothetical protein